MVGDKSNARVHIHTLDPGSVLHYVSALGTMHQVSIRNMDEQHQDYLEMQKQRLPATNVAIIAVAPETEFRMSLTVWGLSWCPAGRP